MKEKDTREVASNDKENDNWKVTRKRRLLLWSIETMTITWL